MHFAKLNKSARLQRVLNLLGDYQPHTTRDIVHNADVCAVNSIISELRANGEQIRCTAVKKGVYEYQLLVF